MAKMLTDDEIIAEAGGFVEQFSVLFLASVGDDGKPEASHAPFIRDEFGNFFILISMLAKHSQNLSYNAQASVLLLEREGASANPFVMKRLQFDCKVERMDRSDESGLQIIALFRGQFGPFIDTLAALGDFNLMMLSPAAAKYVRGFGQTYTLSADLKRPIHVNPSKKG